MSFNSTKFYNKIFAFLLLTRPINIIITFIVVLVAMLISQYKTCEIIFYIFVPLAASLVAASGNIVNDIFDIETDRIAHPDRILVKGILTSRQAWLFYLFLNFLATILTIAINPNLIIIVFVSILLLFIYSLYLKKLPLIGNVTVALLTGLAFIYGGLAVQNPDEAIIPALFAFLINLIREVVKDIQDMDGDAKLGYNTLPIKVGVSKCKMLIIILTIILIVFTFFPFLIQFYKIEYFLIVMVLVNPILIFVLKLMYDKKKNQLELISRLLKVNMLFGLAAIYLGR